MTEPFVNQLAKLLRSVCHEPAEGPIGARQRMRRERRRKLDLMERNTLFLESVMNSRS